MGDPAGGGEGPGHWWGGWDSGYPQALDFKIPIGSNNQINPLSQMFCGQIACRCCPQKQTWRYPIAMQSSQPELLAVKLSCEDSPELLSTSLWRSFLSQTHRTQHKQVANYVQRH
jgi:hypothetical protein